MSVRVSPTTLPAMSRSTVISAAATPGVKVSRREAADRQVEHVAHRAYLGYGLSLKELPRVPQVANR